MAEARGALHPPGIRVQVEEGVAAAALRYFPPPTQFAAAARAAGAALPQVLRAEEADGLLLAWRSPSETLCIAVSAERLSALAHALADRSDGCLVDLTGGVTCVRLRGERIADLICRIGSHASLPAVGEARRSRIADLAVLAVRRQADEVLLILERPYAAHLLGWISETLLDFG
jgi:heterotetrameric sarcosine oxidase gamma subunit